MRQPPHSRPNGNVTMGKTAHFGIQWSAYPVAPRTETSKQRRGVYEVQFVYKSLDFRNFKYLLFLTQSFESQLSAVSTATQTAALHGWNEILCIKHNTCANLSFRYCTFSVIRIENIVSTLQNSNIRMPINFICFLVQAQQRTVMWNA